MGAMGVTDLSLPIKNARICQGFGRPTFIPIIRGRQSRIKNPSLDRLGFLFTVQLSSSKIPHMTSPETLQLTDASPPV
jgi:hypothetical protein